MIDLSKRRNFTVFMIVVLAPLCVYLRVYEDTEWWVLAISFGGTLVLSLTIVFPIASILWRKAMAEEWLVLCLKAINAGDREGAKELIELAARDLRSNPRVKELHSRLMQGA
ncbi:MAG: hypothetical protein QGD94_09165, partial [Planctomycetia bacterium]|nr:hypothetical protein [Planctomycetia bacterium]